MGQIEFENHLADKKHLPKGAIIAKCYDCMGFARYLYTHRDRAGPAMRNKAFRLRIRPDLAGRVCPGFPWMNREAWLLRIQAFKKKRYPSILAG